MAIASALITVLGVVGTGVLIGASYKQYRHLRFASLKLSWWWCFLLLGFWLTGFAENIWKDLTPFRYSFWVSSQWALLLFLISALFPRYQLHLKRLGWKSILLVWLLTLYLAREWLSTFVNFIPLIWWIPLAIFFYRYHDKEPLPCRYTLSHLFLQIPFLLFAIIGPTWPFFLLAILVSYFNGAICNYFLLKEELPYRLTDRSY